MTVLGLFGEAERPGRGREARARQAGQTAEVEAAGNVTSAEQPQIVTQVSAIDRLTAPRSILVVWLWVRTDRGLGAKYASIYLDTHEHTNISLRSSSVIQNV